VSPNGLIPPPPTTTHSFNMVFITPLATLISLSTLSTMASAVTVQKPFLMMSKDADENRLAVKDMFLDSYNTYLFVLPCGAAVAKILTVITGSTRGITMM